MGQAENTVSIIAAFYCELYINYTATLPCTGNGAEYIENSSVIVAKYLMRPA
jgi:hypothetical protein